MPNSLITRLPGQATSVPLLGGGTLTATDRRTEYLRRISQQSKRLRGRQAPNADFAATAKGRQDALQSLVKRGIIPIHVMDGAATLHANVQAYPALRGAETVTVASTNGPYSKVFANPSNADDATLASTGQTDFTATSSVDASATGMARATIA